MKIEDFSRELEDMCAKDEATTVQLLAEWLYKKDLLGYLLQQFSTGNMVKALNGRVNFGEIFGHLVDVIEREGRVEEITNRIGALKVAKWTLRSISGEDKKLAIVQALKDEEPEVIADILWRSEKPNELMSAIGELARKHSMVQELMNEFETEERAESLDMELLARALTSDRQLELIEHLKDEVSLKEIFEVLLNNTSCQEAVDALNNMYVEEHILASLPTEDIIDFYRDHIGMKEDVKVSSEALQKLPENAIVVEQDRNVFRVVGRTRNTLLVESDTTRNRYIVDGDDVILAAPVTVR